MLEAGMAEVTTSQAEKIGLPDWSSVKFMASAKAIVPEADYGAVHAYLNGALDAFLKERTEALCVQLNAWAGLPTQTLAMSQKIEMQAAAPASITSVELVVSRIEQIGRPNKSMIDLFESVKAVAERGTEITTMDRLFGQLETIARQKRDVVIANPRPWTNQR